MLSVQDDIKFGDLVIHYKFASGQHVQECLAIRKEEELKGRRCTLKEVMVERGYLSYAQAEVLQQVLEKRLLECGRCGAVYNLAQPSQEKRYTCKSCESALDVPSLESLQVAIEKLPPPPTPQPQMQVKGEWPDRTTKLVGQKLGGYILLEKIATGGMGTIYRAKQISMNRIVAVKVLFDHFSGDKIFVKRFIHEARAAGTLSHGNIIQVIDVGEQNGIYYFTMEFVEGDDLDSLLRKQGKLPVAHVLDIARQVADALSYAHARGIVHRDIKPANIMITRDRRVKIADLGIAKRLGTFSSSFADPGMIVGTPIYMSPEQVKDPARVDQRSDIYSLGAMMYHLLTGRVPFLGGSVREVIRKLLEEEPQNCRSLNPDVPEYVSFMVHRMMEKDLSARYQSMSEILQDLDNYRQGKQIPWIEERLREMRTATVPFVEEKVVVETSASEEGPVTHRPAPMTSVESQEMPCSKRPAVWLFASLVPTLLERRKQLEKWCVVAFVALAFVITGAALIFLKSQKEQPDPRPPHDAGESRPIASETSTQPRFAQKEVEADYAFRRMEEFEKTNPYDFDEIIDGYTEIARTYDNTKWAREAVARAEEFKKRKQELEAEIQRLRSEALKARSSRSYAEVLSTIDQFMEKCKGGSYHDDARMLRAELVEHARGEFNDARLKAQSAVEAGRLQDAIDIYRSVRNFGIPEMDNEAEFRISELRELLWEKRMLSWLSYEATYAEEIMQLIARHEYQVALSLVEELMKRDDFLCITDDIEEDKKAIHRVVEFHRLVEQGLRMRIGQEETITYKGIRMTGVVSLAEDGTIQIESKWLPNPFRLEAHRMSLDDAIRFARLVIPAGDPVVELAVASEHLLNRRLEEAEALFQTVAESSPDALSAIETIEMREIQSRIDQWYSLFDVNEKFEKYWKPASDNGQWSIDYRFEAIRGSSMKEALLVQQSVFPAHAYIFTLRARKISGVNGFLIAFRFRDKFIYWSIGHDDNTLSTVVGIDKTTIPLSIMNDRWYHIKIVVLEDKALGYLNHELMWRIAPEDIAEALEAKHMGIGTIATEVLYKDIKVNVLK